MIAHKLFIVALKHMVVTCECPVISGCWSTDHAVVLTLMREHHYCVCLYMLHNLMISACC